MSTDFPPCARIKRCSRCGTEFPCGPEAGRGKCWCDELPSVGPVAGVAADCLCRRCLGEAIDQLGLARPTSDGASPGEAKNLTSG